ncbi:porin family protein [Desertivirga brevis]|uniref:porin family protein n=1 Tax=Desertivirga brevis TaxID=2810310 RepID=UPI001A962412|nr:porin family protein [Pedobacter sp. SYSU D00873]
MKKKLFNLLVLMLPFVIKAQETEKNFQLGFTASPNIGWARFNDAPSTFASKSSKIGFSYGLIGDFGFARNYFFSTGFAITSINAKTEENGAFTEGSTSITRSYDIQYIEVPLTIKLKTNTVAEKSFYGQFGLSTAFNIRAKSDVKTRTATVVTDDLKNQSLDNDNKVRLGLVAGAGVQWDYNENSKFITGVTFNNGFTDVLSKRPSIRNSYLALTLGVLF